MLRENDIKIMIQRIESDNLSIYGNGSVLNIIDLKNIQNVLKGIFLFDF